MKYIRLFENFNTPIIYYHGCSSSSKSQEIIKNGVLRPGNENTKRGHKLTPMIGRVYMSPNLYEAVIYCVGGSAVGQDISNWDSVKKDQFGYLFTIDLVNIDNSLPDEDYVGELIYIFHEEEKKNYKPYNDFDKNALKWDSYQ